LHYKIKSILGFTPSKYINEIRLLIAEQLLKNKSYTTISEVCYNVGFQKPTYFSQLFKKRFGKVPSSYLHF
ncbi:MAG: helix-turn-helix domain-containing protein, partial [Chitinophagales bacterium]